MERKIGEIFEYNGEWYQCVKDDMYDYCKGCASFENLRCTTLYGNRDCWLKATCKKLEKAGEPYEYFIQGLGIILQEYILANPSYTCDDNKHVFVLDCQNGRIAIELKQNQEDMEEKRTKKYEPDTELTRLVGRYVNYLIYYDTFESAVKELYSCDGDAKHSNSESVGKDLIPFDLEAAKAGKPVCTRDGRKARIVCFDAKGDQPIIALVEAKGNKDALIEEVERYFINGHSVFEVKETNNDLMMLPEKKEGWVNVYKERCYKTKEEAVKNKYDGCTYIDTIKAEWYE